MSTNGHPSQIVDDDLEPSLLERYCFGTASADEWAQVERWFTRYPDQRLWYERFKAGLQEGDFVPMAAEERTAMVSGILTVALSRQRYANAEDMDLRRRRRWFGRVVQRSMSWRLGSITSFAAGAVTLTLLWMFTSPYLSKNGSAHASTVYTTNAGQRARIELTDGTIITLNVASRLDIPEHFGSSTRTVRLHGEAFFQVAHADKVPFIVEANGVPATVLGTEFGVRAYQHDDVEVMVRSGRVAVQTAVLVASDIAHVKPSRGLLVARNQDVDAAVGFVHGRLVLADIPLRDAIADLNRWYDVDLRLTDPSLGALPIHATLPSGSISDLIEIIRNTFDVRVVRVGRTVTLYAQ